MNAGLTTYLWRGPFANDEINALHAQAFETRIFTDDEWDWNALVGSHSLGWVVARDGDMLVGLIAELQERVELTGEARRVVLLALALAANNGRGFGLNEAYAGLAAHGVDVEDVRPPGGAEAPATLAQALGEG